MNQLGLWYFGNIVVATFLCLNITFLSAIGAPVGIAGYKEQQRAYLDISFDVQLEINNRTVRCSGEAKGSYYPSPMYTCAGISVDNEKFYHGYATEAGRSQQGCTTGCPCGSNIGHQNDIHALCSAMLQAQNVVETLIAAYVVKPVCTPGGDKYHKRVKLYLDKDKKPVWETVLAPNGYINMLQCLTEKPANTGVH